MYRQQSSVKGFSALPPEDRLLKFLVDNSTDCEETVQCSNCDLECKKQVLSYIYATFLSKVFSTFQISNTDLIYFLC